MTRVKSLLFALVVLGLWYANLSFVAPALTTRAVEQANRQAAGVPAAVALKLADRRSALQRAALGLAGSPAALNALKGGKPEALTEVLPEELRAIAVVGLVAEEGSVWARGGEPVPADAAILDLAKLASAGAVGVVQLAFAAPHSFFSVPVVAVEKAELKTLGMVVVGAPLLPEGAAEAVAADLRLSSLAILREGKVVQLAGADKAAGSAAKALKLGQSEVVGRGTLMALGPVDLPMGADSSGAQPPLSVGLHEAVGDYEVAVAVSLAPFMQTLADYQKASLLALAGLLALSGAFLLLVGGGAGDGKEVQPKKKMALSMPAPPPMRTREAEAAALLPMADLPPPPEASPDDFHFGPPPTPPTDAEAPAVDPFSTAAHTSTAPFDLPAPAADAPVADDFGAAVLPGPAPAAAEPGPFFGLPSGDYPDATRIAAVPQELLRASAQSAKERPAASPEDQHFHEVFRDFVATRERCGEPADGLTYEKFSLKLKKNREQLMAKHTCRAVRFQVYVKEGKAALKATPVRD